MTSLISEILRTQAFYGLSSSERTDKSFKWWIESGNYTFNSPPTTKSFDIVANNPEDILRTICHDISRFGNSSIESVANITDEPKFPKSNGWMSIRIYYSAFFAAHCLLRMFGRCCSYFNGPSLKELNSVAQLNFPGSKRISDGNYLIKLNKSGNNIFIAAQDIDSSHAGLWKSFHELLNELQVSIAATALFTTEEKNTCVKFLSDLSRRVGRNGNKSWLSMVRNEINYNHSMNSWSINYTKKSTDNNNIKIYAEKWKVECNSEIFSDNLEEKIEFIETSAAIISLMKDMVISIYKINKVGFLRYTTIPAIRNFINFQ